VNKPSRDLAQWTTPLKNSNDYDNQDYQKQDVNKSANPQCEDSQEPENKQNDNDCFQRISRHGGTSFVE